MIWVKFSVPQTCMFHFVCDVFFGWKSESKLQVSAWFGDATDVQLRKDITEEAFKKKPWWRRRCVENQRSWVDDTQHYWQCVSLSVLSFFVRFVIQNDHDFYVGLVTADAADSHPRTGPNRTPKCRGTERTCRDCSCGQAPDGEWLITYWMTMEQRFCGAPQAWDIFLNDVLMYHVTENSARFIEEALEE